MQKPKCKMTILNFLSAQGKDNNIVDHNSSILFRLSYGNSEMLVNVRPNPARCEYGILRIT